MFEIDIERSFSAAHYLRGYRGNCSTIHGHNWTVRAVVRAKKLDSIGIAVDFKQLKRELDTILAEFDHTDISNHPEFANCNPTSENLAMVIFRRLATRINNEDVAVARIRICESPGSGATYFGE